MWKTRWLIRTYDTNGNILTETYIETIEGSLVVTEKYVYAYDEANNLVNEKYYEGDRDTAPQLVSEYIYDSKGNILFEVYTKTVNGSPIITDKYAYTYTENGNLYTEKYYKSDGNNILCCVYEFTYDVYGNTVSELYYTQETIRAETIDVVFESYNREYEGIFIINEIYQKHFGTLIPTEIKEKEVFVEHL